MQNALWRNKGKRDRSKIFGSWSCPKCGHRLGEVWTRYRIERPYPLEEILVGPALVLPLGVDLRGQDATKEIIIDGTYSKTKRVGWRLTETKKDYLDILELVRQGNDTLISLVGINGENLSPRQFFIQAIRAHGDVAPTAEEIALIYLRSVKKPNKPEYVTAGNFPIKVVCYSDKCRNMCRIEDIVPKNMQESFDRKSTYEFWEWE